MRSKITNSGVSPNLMCEVASPRLPSTVPTRMKRARWPSLLTQCVVLISLATLTLESVSAEDSDYDYGDPNIDYDTISYKTVGADGLSPDAVYDYLDISQVDPAAGAFPLCCREGEVYDLQKCILAPTDFDWTPKLDGAYRASLVYNGFPKCELKKDDGGFIQTYQKDVHFDKVNAKAFLPYYIRLLPISRSDYCITKIYDRSENICEDFRTKILTCHEEKKDPTVVVWTSVALSHIFIILTLLAFFCLSELRCLQGQYMICLLISLLIYNLCVFPGSTLPMDIGDVSCIALGAVKYFFFCGVFLWFNTICFDIWRTMRNRQDVSGRRRFVSYSAYSWSVGAILTTVVLVMPYVKDETGIESRDDPIKDTNYNMCKLKMQMNMILQITQLLSLVIDLVFLVLASCCVCSYSRFGNGLPRCEAVECLKQGWKLLAIMIAHMVNTIDRDILPIPVPVWLFLLLESAAVFGVFAYRRTILRQLIVRRLCLSECTHKQAEDGSSPEKGQLTMT